MPSSELFLDQFKQFLERKIERQVFDYLSLNSFSKNQLVLLKSLDYVALKYEKWDSSTEVFWNCKEFTKRYCW